MRHFLFSVLLFSFLLTSQSGASELDTTKAGEWSLENCDLVNAVATLADAVSTSETSVAFLIEGWTEIGYPAVGSVPGTDERYGTHRINPNMPRFNIDARGKSVAVVLDEITSKHGSYTWSFDSRHRIVNVTEKHLRADSRWPLNWPLGAEGEKPLTFGEARQLLYDKYNYDKGVSLPKPSDPHWDKPDVPLWNPGNEAANATARDMVNAIVRQAFEPKMVYRALMFVGFDTRKGYAGLKDEKELPWSLPLGKARSPERAREVISLYNKDLEEELLRIQREGK